MGGTEKALLAGAIVTALVVRVVNLEGFPAWLGDEGNYIQLGLNVFHGKWGSSVWYPTVFPPLYIASLGLLDTLFGKSFLVGRLLGAVLGTASCFLVYLIGKRLYNPWVGLIAGWLLALFGALHNRLVLLDNGVEVFLLATILAYIVSRDEGSARWGNAAGAFAGLAFLSKYTGIAALVFLGMQGLLERRLGQVWKPLLVGLLVAAVYPLIGLILDWQVLLSSISYHAVTRTQLVGGAETLEEILNTLLLGSGLSQVGPVPPYPFVTLGFISLIAIAVRGDANSRLVAVAAVAVLIAAVAQRLIGWWFLITIYPFYALAIAIFFHDVMAGKTEPLLALFLLLLVGMPVAMRTLGIDERSFREPVLVVALLVFLAFTHRYWGQLLARALGRVPRLPVPEVRQTAARPVLATTLFGLSGLFILGAAAYAEISLFSRNENPYVREVAQYLNEHAGEEDWVAVHPILLPLLPQNNGVFYREALLATVQEPLYVYPLRVLARYRVDVSLGNVRYLVMDDPWFSFESRQTPTTELVSDQIIRQWKLVYQRGPYKVYENPGGTAAVFPSVEARLARGVTLLDDIPAEGIQIEVEPAEGMTVSADDKEVRQGSNSLHIVLNLKGNNTLYFYLAPELRDWSSYTDMTFWWYGDNMKVVAVDLLSPDWSNYYHLPFTDNWNGWRRVWLSLEKATAIGQPSWKGIRILAFKFQSLPARGTVRLDFLRLHQAD